MTTDERLDALISRLEALFAGVNERLDAIGERRAEDAAGLRLELNQIHDKQEEQFAMLVKVLNNTLDIQAEQVKLREGVAEQIQLEVQKKLDNLLPFTTLAAANGTAER